MSTLRDTIQEASGISYDEFCQQYLQMLMHGGREFMQYLIEAYLLSHPPSEPNLFERHVGKQDLIRELMKAEEEGLRFRQFHEVNNGRTDPEW